MKLKPEELAETRERHDSFDAMDDSIDLETMLAYLSLAHDHREILLDHIAALEGERAELRDLLREAKCTNVSHSNTSAVTGHCDFCGKREELLSKQEQEDG